MRDATMEIQSHVLIFWRERIPPAIPVRSRCREGAGVELHTVAFRVLFCSTAQVLHVHPAM